MNVAAKRLLVMILTSLGTLVMSGNLLAGIEYPYNASLGCGDKWEADGCTVKVDCKTREDEFLYAEVDIGLDYSVLGRYSASYYYEEDYTSVCGGYVTVWLEDGYNTKYTCKGDTEFTFKVDCPTEDD